MQRLSVLTLTLLSTVRAYSPFTWLLFFVLTGVAAMMVLWGLSGRESRVTDLLTQVKGLVAILFLNLFHVFQLAPHSDQFRTSWRA